MSAFYPLGSQILFSFKHKSSRLKLENVIGKVLGWGLVVELLFKLLLLLLLFKLLLLLLLMWHRTLIVDAQV